MTFVFLNFKEGYRHVKFEVLEVGHSPDMAVDQNRACIDLNVIEPFSLATPSFFPCNPAIRVLLAKTFN